MKQTDKKEVFHSRVYTNRPAYADFDSPEKFQAILGIIGTRLRQHPNAICPLQKSKERFAFLISYGTVAKW